MRSRSSRFLANMLAGVAFLCLTLLLATLTTTEATAQQATAKIVGIVTDQQGAVVPGVKITVTNTATNVSTSTTTDKEWLLSSPEPAHRHLPGCRSPAKVFDRWKC